MGGDSKTGGRFQDGLGFQDGAGTLGTGMEELLSTEPLALLP